MKTIGIILIAAGIFALIYSGYTFTTEEKVVDLGPIQIEKEKQHHLNWPPVAGAILVLSGAGLMLVNRKDSILN